MSYQVMLVVDGDTSTDLARSAEILRDRPEDQIWYVYGNTVMEQIREHPDRWSNVEAIVIASQKEPTMKVDIFMDRNRTIYDATQNDGAWKIGRRFRFTPQTLAVSRKAA